MMPPLRGSRVAGAREEVVRIGGVVRVGKAATETATGEGSSGSASGGGCGGGGGGYGGVLGGAEEGEFAG
jgi:hypothetical protein